MASAYEKLSRILSLERAQGYQNRAVVGGLERFLSYWQREAREQQEGAAVPSVDDVLGALGGYAGRTPAERAEVVAPLLRALADTVVPESSGGAPAAAAGGSRAQQAPSCRSEARGVAKADRLELDAPVTALRGVSTATEKRLGRLGVRTVRDLLYHLPRRYDDYSDLVTINRLRYGDEVTVVGTVQESRSQRTRRGQHLLRVIISDGTGSIEARWFNQPYLEQRFRRGAEMVISGQVDEYLGRLLFTSPEWEPLQRELLHTGRLVPVYGLTEGLGGRGLRRLLRGALDQCLPGLSDPLPEEVLASADLPGLAWALEQAHFPDDASSLARARRRLCSDELLLVQMGVLAHRRAHRAHAARPIAAAPEALEAFREGLPFALTGAQQRAIEAILADMAQPVPMRRLLHGDVGSGKTAVAAAALLAAAQAGTQAAVLAPTTILAEQHYQGLSALLAEHGVRTQLLVGSLPESEKEQVRRQLGEGEAQVVVGTHALLQESVAFAELGLVVVDEQHRFGVEQRGALRQKGEKVHPHLLAMSATPIPRTLALTVYGDLDVSVLDELPPGRQEVVTAVRDACSRERIYAFIQAQVREGRQAFVVCPLVHDAQRGDARSAVAEHERLQKEVFGHLRVGLLHGQMRAAEKDAVMAAFKAGEHDVLVATAVVEVGIDVPNATVMLVEGAERFGLAQLHQFRGRVGRGAHKSYCILLSEDPSEEALARLRVLEETNDGFALAERDLALRGPGDFFGVRQHGLPPLRVARLSDTAVVEQARAVAEHLFERDPELRQPQHRLLAESMRAFWGAIEYA